ncbi:hypothetical protein [Aquimarina algiphila]|uniref:hypothetical protein n=1 Tax=Aquimarina algiphila TaxID=2047982 RepID=UPI00232F89ED|nr:hypothetical protein [Aquimarina algiphila]
MTIQCSTKWPDKMGKLKGEQTVFVPQILNSLYHNGLISADEITDYERRYYEFTDLQFLCSERRKPHTIREDKTNRWYAGRDIHFKVWQRAPYHSDTFQFAPIIKCVSVQKIVIKYSPLLHREEKVQKVNVWIDGNLSSCFIRAGKIIDCSLTIERLARNDGFQSVEHFLMWFNQNFSGNIIHWTDLKY